MSLLISDICTFHINLQGTFCVLSLAGAFCDIKMYLNGLQCSENHVAWSNSQSFQSPLGDEKGLGHAIVGVIAFRFERVL